jgi:hypothetical protein
MIARDLTFDDLDELNAISATANCVFFFSFVPWLAGLPSSFIVLPRTVDELQHVFDLYRIVGLPIGQLVLTQGLHKSLKKKHPCMHACRLASVKYTEMGRMIDYLSWVAVVTPIAAAAAAASRGLQDLLNVIVRESRSGEVALLAYSTRT